MTGKEEASFGRGGNGDQVPSAEKLAEIEQPLEEEQALGRALGTGRT